MNFLITKTNINIQNLKLNFNHLKGLKNKINY